MAPITGAFHYFLITPAHYGREAVTQEHLPKISITIKKSGWLASIRTDQGKEFLPQTPPAFPFKIPLYKADAPKITKKYGKHVSSSCGGTDNY